jgi:type I restriction enzyme M protein
MVVLLLLTLKRKASEEDWQLLRTELHRNAFPNKLIEVCYKTLSGVDDLWQNIDRISPNCLSALIELISTIDMPQVSDRAFGRLFESALNRLNEYWGKQGPVFMVPREVAILMSQFVPQGAGTTVFNPFAGAASFALNLPANFSYSGQEINVATAAIGRLRLIAHNISDADMAKYILTRTDSITNWPSQQFDCIISSPPFGLKINDLEGASTIHRQVEGFVLEETMKALKTEGVAVYLMGNNVLSADGSIGRIREELLRKGAIRYIIALPDRIFPSTGLKTSIFVLEQTAAKRGEVTLVDATHCFTKLSSRQNTIDIEAIIGLLEHRPIEKVVSVGISDLEISGFQLDPLRYLPLPAEQMPLNETVELRALVATCGERVLTGKGRLIRISDLHEAGNLLPLNVDNIEMASFSRPVKKVSGAALLVAAFGASLKPTFKQDLEPVFVSENILAFSVDTTKVNPMFLVHQLNQDFARMQHERFIIGAVMPRIRLNDFLSIKIELPPMVEMQNHILLDIKEELLASSRKLLDEWSKQIGIEKVDTDSQLRHQIAGPLKNTRYALTSINRILKDQNPDIIGLSLKSGAKSIGDYLKILERDLGSIHRSILTAGKRIELHDLNLEKLDIIAFTRQYADELRERIESRYQVDFEFDADSLLDEGLDTVYINGDPELLRQAFDNLVSNAEKHAFSKNEHLVNRLDIYFMFDFEARKVQVDFSNTGKPFSKDLKWANAIRKGGAIGSSAGDGTGLWLINEVMKLHDGELDFIDETGPHGIHSDLVSTFELYFPIAID